MCVCVLVLQLLLNYALSGGGELVEPIAVLGQEYMSVQLPCALPHADTPPRVQWFDRVHNTSPEPIRIFDSRNNSNRTIDDRHPNKHNYQVPAYSPTLRYRLLLQVRLSVCLSVCHNRDPCKNG